MVQISFTIPAGKVEEYKTAFCDSYNYQETIDEQPNPESKADFAKRQVKEHMINVHRSWRVNNAADLARETSSAEADIDIT